MRGCVRTLFKTKNTLKVNDQFFSYSRRRTHNIFLYVFFETLF